MFEAREDAFLVKYQENNHTCPLHHLYFWDEKVFSSYKLHLQRNHFSFMSSRIVYMDIVTD